MARAAAPPSPSTGRVCPCWTACVRWPTKGFITGASGRNWAGYGADVQLPEGFSATDRALLTDPQTSGGLLVSCDASAVDEVLAVFRRHGFEAAAEVGEVIEAGVSGLVLRPWAAASKAPQQKTIRDLLKPRTSPAASRPSSCAATRAPAGALHRGHNSAGRHRPHDDRLGKRARPSSPPARSPSSSTSTCPSSRCLRACRPWTW